MNEYISRQAAKLKVAKVIWEDGDSCNDFHDKCVDCLNDVPSEQIRINLNEKIKVKLTDWGKEIYYHQHDRVNQIAGREICKPSFPKEDENGYTEFQMWCFIELYGTHMGMTLPNVIDPLEIVYEGGELMREYIERQAAIDELNGQIEYCNKALESFDISLKDEYAVKVERASLIAYKEQLEAIPAADVAPAVRCGQCKYWQDNDSDYDYGYCYAEDGHGFGHAWGKNDFCSYGERKE